MARSIDPGTPFPYILKSDRDLPEDAPDRTVWMIRTLDPKENAKIQDVAGYMENDQFMVRSGTVQLETLRRGLISVDKFPDNNGGYLEIDRKNIAQEMLVTDAFISRIALTDRAELADAINSGGRLGVEVAGKS